MMRDFLPGVIQTLELLESLKSTVRDFAAREEKLSHEFAIRSAKIRQGHEVALEELNAQLTADLGKADLDLQIASDAVEAEHARRKTKITHAHRRARKYRLDNVDTQEGVRKHRLQTETLQNERGRTEGLQTTEKNYEEMKLCIAGDQQALAALEQKAHSSFAGYPSFRRLFQKEYQPAESDLKLDDYALLNELRESMDKTNRDLGRFRKMILPLIFRFTWLWIVILVCIVPSVPVLQYFKIDTFTYPKAIASTVGMLVFGVALHFLGKRQGLTLASSIAAGICRARSLYPVCLDKCEARHTSEIARIENEFQTTRQRITQEWNTAVTTAAELRESWPRRLDEKADRIAYWNNEIRRLKLELLKKQHAERVAGLQKTAADHTQELNRTCDEKLAQLEAESQSRWQPMQAEWKAKVPPLYQQIQAANTEAEKLFLPWDQRLLESWTPAAQFAHAAKFGRIDVDLKTLAEALPKDPRLPLPGPVKFSLPLLLTYPDQGSILIETNQTERDQVVSALNNIILRLLSVTPPGRLVFTIIDPVGLGENFSGIMQLADYAEHVINSRIWTQTNQIEPKLAEMNEHIEKVIQMYLRNEYATIAEYNEQAGNIAEKYHFLVVADFPNNFSDLAARRLMSIATSGARCGVFTLIHWDRRQPNPQDFVPEDLRRSSISLTCKGQHFTFTGNPIPGVGLVLDNAPSPEYAIQLTQKIGLSSRMFDKTTSSVTRRASPSDVSAGWVRMSSSTTGFHSAGAEVHAMSTRGGLQVTNEAPRYNA